MKRYIAFRTDDKVIGLVKLPLDGSPNNSVSIIAHCGKINHFDVSNNGKLLFTAGDNDISVNVW